MIGFKKEVKEVLNKLEKYDFFIAGGHLTAMYNNTVIDNQDVDIYFESKHDYKRLKKWFDNNFKLLSSTDNAITYYDSNKYSITEDKTTYQLIYKSFGTPEKIMKSFDLNKSMIAFDGKKLIYDPRFFNDLEVEKFHSDTLNRYMKYSIRYNMKPNFAPILSHFLDNHNMKYYYDNISYLLKSIDVLGEFIGEVIEGKYSTIYQTEILQTLESLSSHKNFKKFTKKIVITPDFRPTNILCKLFYYLRYKKNHKLYIYTDDIKEYYPEYLF